MACLDKQNHNEKKNTYNQLGETKGSQIFFIFYAKAIASLRLNIHHSIHEELADMDCCGNGNRKLLTSIIIQVDALQWVGFLLLGLTFVAEVADFSNTWV